MLIGISGLAGVGKDTCADFLVEDQNYVKLAFSDPLKRACRSIFDFHVPQLWGPSSERNAPDMRYPRSHTIPTGSAVCACCGWDSASPPTLDCLVCHLTPRYALQLMGTEYGRHCYGDIWVKLAVDTAGELMRYRPWIAEDPTCEIPGHVKYTPQEGIGKTLYKGALGGVVIPDVRFKNEIQGLKAAGAKLIRVKRRGYERPRWNHPSETEQLEVPDHEFDAVIENEGVMFQALKKQLLDKVWGLRT